MAAFMAFHAQLPFQLRCGSLVVQRFSETGRDIFFQDLLRLFVTCICDTPPCRSVLLVSLGRDMLSVPSAITADFGGIPFFGFSHAADKTAFLFKSSAIFLWWNGNESEPILKQLKHMRSYGLDVPVSGKFQSIQNLTIPR